MELRGFIQKYEWGKIGTASKVATLYKASDSSFEISESSYAELWMGTHPTGPSKLKCNATLLSDVIKENPQYLGSESEERFGRNLPFLFKVLSIKKALSIQAHPSKKHAEELYAKQPMLYKDPNHKPELAVALTPFKAMCGFRPLDEIKKFLDVVPELKTIVGSDNADKLLNSPECDAEDNLKTCFKHFMLSSEETITEQLKKLLSRQKNLDCENRGLQLSDLVEELYSQFPNDVGVFSPYFLNVLNLQPGEAIYLGPNVPHAYLSGDCVECMACSDNVVRAGLTPKFKDVETLCSMLEYKGKPASAQVFEAVTENEYTKLFKPPVPDFAVAEIKITCNQKVVPLIERKTASILICIEGEGFIEKIPITSGTIIFLPAKSATKVESTGGGVLIYQAFANV